MEAAFEIICNDSDVSEELWQWAKAMNDSYAIQLEKEYLAWRKKVGLN